MNTENRTNFLIYNRQLSPRVDISTKKKKEKAVQTVVATNKLNVVRLLL